MLGLEFLTKQLVLLFLFYYILYIGSIDLPSQPRWLKIMKMAYQRTDSFFSEGVSGEGAAFTKMISHEAYANMYGPTTGDKIRLGDTNLYAEIERDLAVYGDECVFGGGKVIRDGMGQSCVCEPAKSLDTVITNAVIIDYSGIYKACIGIKHDRIVAIGKSGNPDIMNDVHPDMIIGVSSSHDVKSH